MEKQIIRQTDGQKNIEIVCNITMTIIQYKKKTF